MKRINTHRIIAIVIIGVLFGLYRHHDYARWSTRGRDVFITFELHRFDKYMAHPWSVPKTLFLTTVEIAVMLGIYELLVLVLATFFPQTRSTAPITQPAPYTRQS